MALLEKKGLRKQAEREWWRNGRTRTERKQRNQARKDFQERASSQIASNNTEKDEQMSQDLATRKTVRNLMSPSNKIVKAEAKIATF